MALTTKDRRWGRPRTLVVLSVAATLTLTACGGGDEGGSASGESLPLGASIQEYQAAFEDIDPITLIAQTAGNEGSFPAKGIEAYWDAVTEWSGGKIEFEKVYAAAIAPAPEVPAAIEDGRLDISYITPSDDPGKFPAANSLNDLTIMADQSPLVGTLAMVGMMVEASTASEEIVAEMEDHGLHPLIPLYALGPEAMLCAEPRTGLADFDGLLMRVNSRLQPIQMDALGMTGVSINFTEAFEGLQRGVVDCTSANPLTATLSGLFEVVPHAVLEPAAGFSAGVAGLAINQDIWNSLPLPARQLLHDRTDVFLQHHVAAQLETYQEMVTQTVEYGGDVRPLDDDAREALVAVNEKILEDSREELPGVSDPDAFVDTAQASVDKWRKVVTEELGFDGELTPAEFNEWYTGKGPEAFEDYASRLFNEVQVENRPS